jgi:hypothetical protein
MWSKVERFLKGMYLVGGVTTVSNISTCMCLISIKMHVYDACNIIMYSVAMVFTVNSINFVC